jgi:hypothetical protein
VASLQPHVDRHAILGLEKQFHASDVIGDAAWWVNLDEGTIVFGGELEMGAALLGTEASGTWLWGWANPGGFPEPVIATGLAAYEYGAEHDLPALTEPESALSEDVGLDRIGIVVSGALGLQATYTGPLDEDARILIGLEHPSLELPAPEPARTVTVLTSVLQSGVVSDWPAALEAYRAQRGDDALDGVEIELDELGRIRNLRA